MKSLRSKIFIFICLLLLLLALPLSVFIMQLLDRSYRIGINERVESALDGALQISSDFYQMHKSRVQLLLQNIQKPGYVEEDQISQQVDLLFPGAKHKLFSGGAVGDHFVSQNIIQKFLNKNERIAIWPNEDHTCIYALARLENQIIFELKHDLPESFISHAKRIQEVNQIYKTLGFVQSDIRTSFLLTFLSIYLFGVLLALVVSYYISTKITKPIGQLITATNEIGRGNLSYRIPISGKDEFSVLGSAFNDMVLDLKQNQRRILELEKMATWQQLARKLAHEIKNPLTPIRLMAQQMHDQYDGADDSYKKMLSESSSIIEEEVESLQRLVREFSDFARLPEFKLIKQDVVPLLLSIEKLYSNANIELSLPAFPVEITFDYDYLKRVIINLIDNALAATDDQRIIKIKLNSSVNNNVSITVNDTGEGITEQNLAKIFEPYFSTKRSGVGLGLAIVKKIIEEHSGQIEVSSKVGQGTTFTILLPA